MERVDDPSQTEEIVKVRGFTLRAMSSPLGLSKMREMLFSLKENVVSTVNIPQMKIITDRHTFEMKIKDVEKRYRNNANDKRYLPIDGGSFMASLPWGFSSSHVSAVASE